MLYYVARWYDAQSGRFLSPDSIVPQPGNLQSLDRFAYAGNNPLRYSDPTGHYMFEETPDDRSVVVTQRPAPPQVVKPVPSSPSPLPPPASLPAYTEHDVMVLANVAIGEEGGWFITEVVDDYYFAWIVVNRVLVGHSGACRLGYASCATEEHYDKKQGRMVKQFGGYLLGRTVDPNGAAAKAVREVLAGTIPDPTGGAVFFRDDTKWGSDQSVIGALKVDVLSGWIEETVSEPQYDDRCNCRRSVVGHYAFSGPVPMPSQNAAGN